MKTFQWKAFFISCVIISIGAYFIHIKDYDPVQLSAFFMFLPVVWIGTFARAFGLHLFLGGSE